MHILVFNSVEADRTRRPKGSWTKGRLDHFERVIQRSHRFGHRSLSITHSLQAITNSCCLPTWSLLQGLLWLVKNKQNVLFM
jgi:hypothetical protein